MKRNALTVLGTKHAPAGKYADGHGLWLRKRRRDHGNWFLRLQIGGRRREMGLGTWPDVSIAEARERAATARRRWRDGVDPIKERRIERLKLKQVSVAEAITGCFKARQAELKNDGQAGQWLSPLNVYVIPKIGTLSIEELDQHILRDLFAPIWHEKPESAKKAINRLNLTLKHAAALGLDVDLQAVLKAKALLGKQRRERTHIPSMPYSELPEYYHWLELNPNLSAAALRFLILTGARTGEVLGLRFAEIEGDVWHLPPERTKSSISHRIPLSYAAMTIVEGMREPDADLVFRSRGGKPLSNMAMLNLMKKQGHTARPHGFRATFRTWLEEMTDAPFEVKETCLAHSVGDATVQAYQRSDHLEKRRQLMTQWARYCAQGPN